LTSPAPDVETSSDGYARRFAGPVGAFFLEVQSRLTLSLLEPFAGASVLDVGGGHAQLAGPLAERGFSVTVLGSDAACATRLRPLLDTGRVRFETGDLLAAPFPDRAFDVVLSFRLLPHVAEWPRLVGELCRLARRAAVVDYPSRRSVNAFADALFGWKRGVEKDTRPFLVFRDAEVAAEFRRAGLEPRAARREFLFPMALHRAHRSAGLARGLEALAAGLGLRALAGSPVILRADRAAS
jgi:SAM-dependent methyltransferase